MDSEILYALVGVVFFILVIVFTLKSGSQREIQTKEEKRTQIIYEYKKQLLEELESLKGDKQAMLSKKSELLKKFSNELSMNIFFDNDEIREIILNLSKE